MALTPNHALIIFICMVSGVFLLSGIIVWIAVGFGKPVAALFAFPGYHALAGMFHLGRNLWRRYRSIPS